LNIKNRKNIVIKIGTSSITRDNKINNDVINSLAKVISEFQDIYTFTIVTSGAVGLGANILNYDTRPSNLKKLQVASSVGQIELVNEYKSEFRKYGLNVAQLLLTKNLIDNREQFVNTTQALNQILAENIVPVINENDVVATEELKYGDNDRLSAIVSIILNAKKLILITNQDGLFEFDPNKRKDAKKIDYIEFNSDKLNDLIPVSSSGDGVGGFSTKIMASQMAGYSGVQTQIISWSEANLRDAINDNQVGTLIKESDKKIKLKKLWIVYGMKEASIVDIDKGAYDALHRNSSLLSKGVVKYTKSFSEGEGLAVRFENNIFAKGIAKCSNDNIKDSSVLIHIDDLIIL
tara:strand:+ start:6587 stop:7633 length:1047 start_codon:yes stop_codon:yes gene_type:complete